MVLQPPRLQGTEAFIRIYNKTARKARLAATACAACAPAVRGHRPDAATLETKAGLLNCWQARPAISTPSTWAHRSSLEGYFRSRKRFATPGRSSCRWPDRRRSVLHYASWSAWAIRMRLRVDDVNAYDLARFADRCLENHPTFGACNITLAHIVDRDHIRSHWRRRRG